MALSDLVEAARAAIGSGHQIVGASAGSRPRFELFHAANSICSQKVRSVLAHHALAYVSHGMDLFAGQTYLPEYVRLRMVGCERHGGALVSRHSGSTSATLGCDAVVVPTLVDLEAQAVVVDSRAICLYLDALVPDAARLRPTSLAAPIDRQIDAVDHVPNYQLLMGRQADPATFSQRKVAWCDRYLAAFAEEPALVAAYSAKRAKELSAASDLFGNAAMAVATAKVTDTVEALEAALADRPFAFLYSDEPTMADLFWGIELLRIDNLGHGGLWSDGHRPAVAAFAAQVRALPALRSAIVEWPGALY